MTKIFKLFAACGSMIFASGLLMGAQDEARPQPSQDPISTYRLRPLDVLNIKVFKEPDLDTVYKIGTNGMIVMPPSRFSGSPMIVLTLTRFLTFSMVVSKMPAADCSFIGLHHLVSFEFLY